MKAGHGKRKGSKFERDICKQLSLWWSKGKKDDLLWRSQSSGGRATSRGKQGKTTKGQCGDICSTDPSTLPLMDVVTIEAKCGYSAFSFADVVDRPLSRYTKQKWEVWFEQVWNSWSQSGSFSWWLITKRNGRETMVFMPLDLFELLPVYRSLQTSTGFVQFCGEFMLGEGKKRMTLQRTLVGMNLELFLLVVKPEMIKELSKIV